jgi:para-aminobenzoate synthetase/4-amino-4-deoxychorismate lyase
VFETVLVLGGEPVELDAHLQRIGRSVGELFGHDLPPGVRELVLERAAPLSLGRLRLTAAPAKDRSLGLAVGTATVDPGDLFPPWERAISLRPLLLPGGLGPHKWADRGGAAWSEAGAGEDCLPLVLDQGHEVLEASRANLFAVEDGALVTPAADGRILPGIARAKAIETAAELGIQVREESLSLERLIDCAEVFLTGSVRGIEPVRALGDRRLGTPGELVDELSAELERSWTGSSRPSSVPAR